MIWNDIGPVLIRWHERFPLLAADGWREARPAEDAAEPQLASDAWGQRPLFDGYVMMTQLVNAAIQHASAVALFSRSEDDPYWSTEENPLPFLSAGRSCLEALGRAFWLARPDLTPDERCMRYVQLTRSSAAQVAKLGPDSADAKEVRDNYDAEARARNWVAQDKGLPEVFATDLVKELLGTSPDPDGASVYRLLSAATHAAEYMLDAIQVDDPSRAGVRSVRLTAVQRRFVLLGMRQGVRQADARFAELFGWQT